MAGKASTLAEQVAVKEIETGRYVSLFEPDRMGNTANIAYGGCSVAMAIAAACHSVPDQYHLYTAMGNFLGPALTDRKLFATVRKIRDTRTFATRQVEVSQEQDDGSSRPCMIVLLDFQTQEPSTVLTYSETPFRTYAPFDDLPSGRESYQNLVDQGIVKQEVYDLQRRMFAMMDKYFDAKYPPEGMMFQLMNGMIKRPTTQDHMPITEKTSADYFRAKHKLETWQDQAAGLGFIMDGALSFVPLTHSTMSLADAGACSSLDFALRLFVNDVDINEWHFREYRTVTGGNGRTYSESRLWDAKGRMVANMTQQSILRPKPPPKQRAKAAL